MIFGSRYFSIHLADTPCVVKGVDPLNQSGFSSDEESLEYSVQVQGARMQYPSKSFSSSFLPIMIF